MDDRLQAAIAIVRAEYPEARLFQIGIPGDEEIYLARKCAWNEYKRLIGAVKDEVTANEILVQKFLVHPKLSYEQIDLQMDPGKVVILAQQIQKGLGFVTDGVTLKKRLNRARREVETSWYRQARAYICDRFGWRFADVDQLMPEDVIEALASVQYLADQEEKAVRKNRPKTPSKRR